MESVKFVLSNGYISIVAPWETYNMGRFDTLWCRDDNVEDADRELSLDEFLVIMFREALVSNLTIMFNDFDDPTYIGRWTMTEKWDMVFDVAQRAECNIHDHIKRVALGVIKGASEPSGYTKPTSK